MILLVLAICTIGVGYTGGVAWEKDQSPNNVMYDWLIIPQKLVDSLKSKLCCLPICCVAWLCSHIAVIASTERNRPLSLLQIICSPSTSQFGVPLQIYDNER